jgi:hypothetical protein
LHTNNPPARLLVGKTHQLRVACKSLGAPVLGDATYAGAAAAGEDRAYLHAAAIRIRLPPPPSSPPPSSRAGIRRGDGDGDRVERAGSGDGDMVDMDGDGDEDGDATSSDKTASEEACRDDQHATMPAGAYHLITVVPPLSCFNIFTTTNENK